MRFSRPFENLIDFFGRFRGIGPKSAQKMAFQLLKMPLEDIEKFASQMVEAKKSMKYCSVCFNMSDKDPCEICSDTRRDATKICVVTQTKDLIAIEKTNEFRGLYHVLQGLISPMDGIGADDIRIKELVERVAKNEISEVILALTPSVEGEATSLYIAKILKPFNVKVTGIAFGIPIGSDIEYADEITLAKALEGRREL